MDELLTISKEILQDFYKTAVSKEMMILAGKETNLELINGIERPLKTS